jgi:hypothetical protein
VIHEAAEELPNQNVATKNTDAKIADISKTVIQPLDFSTTYQANRTPIVDQPILANHCSLVSQDDMRSLLEMQSKDGKTIRIMLTVELMLALTNMLQLATKEASWDLAFTHTHFMMTESSTRPVIH